MPRVTVILTSLNHSRFIADAIQSVLDQTFSDFELFVIDDFSEDNSWEVIQSFSDPRIVAIQNSKRMRGAYGINQIIGKLARGEFVAIHHSDDLFLPQKLEKQVAFLDAHPAFGAVFSHANIINEEGAPFTDPDHFYSSIFRQQNRTRFEWLRHFFFQGNCLCHPSVLARRSAYLNTGLYDRRLGQLPDFDMWIRMCLQYEIHILDEPLVKFRVRDGEANQSGQRQETMARDRNEWPQVLRNFTKINTEQELHAIFPEIRNRFPAESPLGYQLAILAIETESDVKQAFGLNLLYVLMANKCTSIELEQYGFSYIDLNALSGKCDIFRKSDLYRVERDIRVLRTELDRVKKSFSWQITKPLRLIKSTLRQVFTARFKS